MKKHNSIWVVIGLVSITIALLIVVVITKTNIDILKLKLDLVEYELDLLKYIQKDEPTIPDYNRLKNANVMILNSLGYQGSGTVIKYKNKMYILTVAHLFDDNPNTTQILTLYNNNHDDGVLKIIKRDEDIDLMLCELPEKFKVLDYVELAEREPKDYSDIVIVGNPLSLEDFVSKGLIYTYYQTEFAYIDHSYFGNSGGGIFYNNQLVGVTSKIANVNYYNIPFTLNIAVRLDTIKEFLKGVLNE